MSRFYGSLTGGRGEVTRTGTPSSGIRGHLRGWNVGIGVDGDARGDDDAFTAYATTGSNGAGGYGQPVFTVHVQPDGLRIVNLDDAFGGGAFVLDVHGNVTQVETV